jgi:ELWxxDGT repeat protein
MIWNKKRRVNNDAQRGFQKKQTRRQRRHWLPMIEALEDRFLPSIAPYLVADVHPTALVSVGGTLYFAGDDGVHGNELWRSDGSPGGTVMIADINSGSAGSNPYALTNINGTLFFDATDGTHGTELWRSNGTASGTLMVKDINPGSADSRPLSLTNANGTVFFSADDGVHGHELWESNGTTNGTFLLLDLYPGGTTDSAPLANVNGSLFFQSAFELNPGEFWATNGTAAGTVLLKDFRQDGGGHEFPDGVNVNGTFFFHADDGVHGFQLWKSNGTVAGTVMVKDISPGNPGNLTNVNGTLFLSTLDSAHGVELWRSDGSPTGTTLVQDIIPGFTGSYPTALTNVSGTLFFQAGNPFDPAKQLWRSDGTGAGTTMVSNLNVNGLYFGFNANVNGALYFYGNDGVHGFQLYRSNGTEAGTTLVADLNPSGGSDPHYLTNVNGTLFFAATDGINGTELWGLHDVAPADTTTTITALDNSPPYGENDVYTATVSALSPATGAPSNGTVTFHFDGGAGVTAAVWGGRATITHQWLQTGSGHTVDATFNGNDSDGAFHASTAAQLMVTVVQDTTSTVVGGTVTNIPNAGGTDSYLNQPATLVATVSSTHGGTPVGTVTFLDGAITLQSGVTLSPGGTGQAVATFSTAGLSFGPHTITAVYSGNSGAQGFVGSTSPSATHTVDYPPPRLLQDIVPGTLTSVGYQSPPPNPVIVGDFTAVGTTAFFVGPVDSFNHAPALWKSDGTAAGTVMVGSPFVADVKDLTNVNGTLFFIAGDGTHGDQLWRSDGQATTVLTDLVHGIFGYDYQPDHLVNVSGTLFFTTTGKSASGGFPAVPQGIWQSNGTPAGTMEIEQLPNAVFPGLLTNVSGTLFFAATHFQGTQVTSTLFDYNLGTGVFTGLNPPTGSFHGGLSEFTNVNGALFFRADDGVHGQEVWRANGAPQGTVMVADISPGQGSAFYPSEYTPFANVNDTLFFSASDGVHGQQLWETNGTAAGTTMLVTESNGGVLGNLANVNGTLFFSAVDPANGAQLWTSNGTAAGTRGIQKVSLTGSTAQIPPYITDVKGTAFFIALGPKQESQLWESNGTTAGTFLVMDSDAGLEASPANGGSNDRFVPDLTNVNGTLLFSFVDVAHGIEPWTSNGTVAGTVLLKDLSPASSSPSQFTNVGGTAFFSSTDGIHGQELWESNGTPGSAVLVKDINPGSKGSYPTQLTNVNGTLFFSANDGVNGNQLWESNGTAGGTFLVKAIDPGPNKPILNPEYLTNVNGTLFFSATNGKSGQELWRSNGTAANTVLIKDIRPGALGSYPNQLINVNGTLFFTADDGIHGREIFKSNGIGTGQATTLLKDVNPGTPGSSPTNLTNLNGTLFFTATNGVSGEELWKSNGTAPGTVIIKDIKPGSVGSYPKYLTNVNGTLFFSATNGISGQELWRSNGTAPGTFLVKDIKPGGTGSYPSQLTNVNGTLYFVANDGVHGPELFKSNGVGTGVGTTLVKDLWPGSAGSSPTQLTNVNGLLIFAADDPGHGDELWVSNGTTPGTVLLADINQGFFPFLHFDFGSYPSSLSNVNGTLYFAASDGVRGVEPWTWRD